MKSKKKNALLLILLIAIIAIAVGYAAMSQQLTINGTANISADWDVKITGIEATTQTGATDKTAVSYTDTTATFDVNLEYPGATATYAVTVANEGSIDAVLTEVKGISEANAADPTEVTFTIDAAADDTLNSGTTKTYNVTVTWADSDSIPTTTSKTATITLDYTQAQ